MVYIGMTHITADADQRDCFSCWDSRGQDSRGPALGIGLRHRRLLLPALTTGRAEGILRRRPKRKKPSHPPQGGTGRLRSLPQDSLRRRVRLSESSWAGFLAFGSSPHPQPSPSAQGRTVAGNIAWEDMARRSQWRDRGRFARPFLFPVVQTGHRRNPSCQRTNNADEPSTAGRALSTSRI